MYKATNVPENIAPANASANLSSNDVNAVCLFWMKHSRMFKDTSSAQQINPIMEIKACMLSFDGNFTPTVIKSFPSL